MLKIQNMGRFHYRFNFRIEMGGVSEQCVKFQHYIIVMLTSFAILCPTRGIKRAVAK